MNPQGKFTSGPTLELFKLEVPAGLLWGAFYGVLEAGAVDFLSTVPCICVIKIDDQRAIKTHLMTIKDLGFLGKTEHKEN